MKDYHKIYKLNKYYNSILPKHHIINYKNLYSCNMYKNSNKYEAILIIKKYIHRSSIHFKNKKQLNIVKKYLYKDGLYSHFCCYGKGVIFINTDYQSNRF